MEEGRDFQSDCKLQLAPLDIHLIRKDDATVCSLLMQTRCHKFIATLCILNEILTHSEVLRKTLQHRELIFPALLSAVSYCHAKLDDILRRKDKILVTLGDDQAENDKFTEASTNFLSGFIQLMWQGFAIPWKISCLTPCLCSWPLARYSRVTGELMRVTSASNLNDSPVC